MRAWGEWPPAVRAVVAVAATCVFMVSVAWATLLGPDEVFTGPGPQPSTVTTSEACIPLPVRTLPDGSLEVQYPDDYSAANASDYCPVEGAGIDEYRDIVDDNPPPWWIQVLVTVFLGAVLAAFATFVAFLLVLAVRALLAGRRQERAAVALTPLDEPVRVATQLVEDAEEQDALLRDGDARNAIVATWHRFEVQGQRAGVPRRASETSSEYALRILDLAEADTGQVRRLAELYREARFSDHPITEAHRSEALAVLAAIRRSLGVRA